MAYSIDVKEKAFGLFCMGNSYDSIAEAMDAEGIKITRRTLIKWNKQYGWAIRRRNVVKDARQKTDQRTASDIAELSAQLAELQSDLIDELRNVPLKSKEGGITALRQLHDMRQRLLGDKRFTEQIDELIGVIFEILANDEVIGPMLQNRQQVIIEKLETLLREKYGIR